MNRKENRGQSEVFLDDLKKRLRAPFLARIETKEFSPSLTKIRGQSALFWGDFEKSTLTTFSARIETREFPPSFPA